MMQHPMEACLVAPKFCGCTQRVSKNFQPLSCFPHWDTQANLFEVQLIFVGLHCFRLIVLWKTGAKQSAP
jgi:hypothetical protein